MAPTRERPHTLPALLESRANTTPDRIAFRFLVDGESDEQTLTYEALDRRARQIAATLLMHARPGDRALLLHPPGLEFVAALFGALYAGVIAVPAYPPLPATLARVLPRLAHLVSDADVRVILTCAASRKAVEAVIASAGPRGIDVLLTDGIDGQAADVWARQEPEPESIAILQYTSGSTAQPRGVRLSHSNLMHNSEQICHLFGHSADSVGVIWLPPYHDMGLTGGILQPVFAGFPVTLFSPFAFLQRPVRWLQAITRTRATGSGGPNFAYDVCVRKVTAEQRASLDLSSWRVAFNGAERVRSDTLRRFAETFAECGFKATALYPCYGLAEATLLASGGTAATSPPVRTTFLASALQQRRVVPAADTEPGTIELVGLGPAIPDQEIAIVDPETRRRSPGGSVGEIWLSGPSVAQGYWGRPAETERVFHAHIADTGEGPFLRTGDLGFLHDNGLFVTGRLQDLIVVRGRNHHPEDIEASVEGSDAAIRTGGVVAFSVDVDGEEQVVVMVEIDRRATTPSADVEVAVRRAAAEHGLSLRAVMMLEPGEIPRTTSGKVQRHVCRAMYVGRGHAPAQKGEYAERGHHAER